MKDRLIYNELIKQGFKESIFNEHEISLISTVDEAIYLSLRIENNGDSIVVIKKNPFEATLLYEQLRLLVSENQCLLYIPEESLRVESIASSPENRAQTIETLNNCLSAGRKIVVCSVGAFIKHIPKPEIFKERVLNIRAGDNYSIAEVKEKLIKTGYRMAARVDQPLTFSVRGGIVDIYSINYENPIRIEFFDTDVESIRFFDISSQRTISKVDEVVIIPATLLLFDNKQITELEEKITDLSKKNKSLEDTLMFDLDYIKNRIPDIRCYNYYSLLEEKGSLLDYLENPVIVINEEDKIKEHMINLLGETTEYIDEMHSQNKMIEEKNVFHDFDHLIGNRKTIINEPLKNSIRTGIKEVIIFKGNIEKAINSLLDYDNNIKVIALKEKDANIIMEHLINNKIPYQIAFDNFKEGVNLYFKEFVEGFEYRDLVVFSTKEIFQKSTKIGRYQNKYKDAIVLRDYQELDVMDYVVHNQYGIGRYLGIMTKEYNGIHRDYLKIMYSDNDELLVPIDQFGLVRKYASKEGISIKLHKLGSDKWSKTKEKVRENVQELAKKLVEIYTERQKDVGFSFSKDNEDQIQFEEDFEYELTEDQKTAVVEVKADMENVRPMDRLLCGDVGFGKTEVAIRAAFKAIYDGKQVAFLCPTTVLSMQHNATFMERFKGYPIRIEVLNRFIPPAKQKLILKDILQGKVDILIGTHRILSKDLSFNDLGLLVIDEEQRFGVEHKERIKEMKNGVDVLSLSATPIPRTLQMSLVGMRTLSTLNTPPLNRLPVQTYVVEKSRGLIIEVIQRELQRKGQVFYLYNNIKQIYEVQRMIQGAIKGATVGVVHGQMSKEEIENVMVEFNLNLINVLVCTTIIETGIDIPNANTIVIENAHRFGLSQLYQIRGRVGRSSRLAYAYLMIPKLTQISEIQEKRLKAIKEFTELGSGYKIAKRDLMIRGAGEILGPTQSGFIDSIGIDMYLEMLREAVNIEKGIVPEREIIIKKANIKLDNYVPQKYAPYDYEKIGLYRYIDSVVDIKELKEYKYQIIDQHGKMPKEVENVFIKRELDILINQDYIKQFRENTNTIEITFTKDFSDTIDGVKLFEYYNSINTSINIVYKNQEIHVLIPVEKGVFEESIEIIKGSKRCIRNENR